MATPTLKLTYFPIGGRAESIRLAFVIGDIAFEDERLAGPEFGAQKAAGKFKNGNVPVLEIDGVQYAQSNALLVYAGQIAGNGLYPSGNPLAELQVNQAIFDIEDAVTLVGNTLRESDQEKKLAARAAITAADGALTAWMKRFDAQLGSNAGYFAGSGLTVADLKAVAFFHWFTLGVLDGIPTDYLNQFANVAKFHQTVLAHPKIAAYYASKK